MEVYVVLQVISDEEVTFGDAYVCSTEKLAIDRLAWCHDEDVKTLKLNYDGIKIMDGFEKGESRYEIITDKPDVFRKAEIIKREIDWEV